MDSSPGKGVNGDEGDMGTHKPPSLFPDTMK